MCRAILLLIVQISQKIDSDFNGKTIWLNSRTVVVEWLCSLFQLYLCGSNVAWLVFIIEKKPQILSLKSTAVLAHIMQNYRIKIKQSYLWTPPGWSWIDNNILSHYNFRTVEHLANVRTSGGLRVVAVVRQPQLHWRPPHWLCTIEAERTSQKVYSCLIKKIDTNHFVQHSANESI